MSTCRALHVRWQNLLQIASSLFLQLNYSDRFADLELLQTRHGSRFIFSIGQVPDVLEYRFSSAPFLGYALLIHQLVIALPLRRCAIAMQRSGIIELAWHSIASGRAERLHDDEFVKTGV